MALIVANVTLLALNTVLRESSSGCLTLPDFVAANFACVLIAVLLTVGHLPVAHVLASGVGDRTELVSTPFWPCRIGAVCTAVVGGTLCLGTCVQECNGRAHETEQLVSIISTNRMLHPDEDK